MFKFEQYTPVFMIEDNLIANQKSHDRDGFCIIVECSVNVSIHIKWHLNVSPFDKN